MIYKLGDHTVITDGDDYFVAPSASVMGSEVNVATPPKLFSCCFVMLIF